MTTSVQQKTSKFVRAWINFATIAAAVFTVTEADAQTYITATSLGVAGQQRFGVWTTGDGSLRRFARWESNGLIEGGIGLIPRRPDGSPGLEDRIRLSSYGGHSSYLFGTGGGEYVGLSLYVTTDRTKCPDFAWWGEGTLTFDGTSARKVIDARKIDVSNCTLRPVRDLIEVRYERLVGARFTPIRGNQYIYLITVPGRGFRSAVRFQWDYSGLRPQGIRASVRHPNGSTTDIGGSRAAAGNHEYVTEMPGRYEFFFDVVDRRGTVIHRDRIVAEIPRL